MIKRVWLFCLFCLHMPVLLAHACSACTGRKQNLKVCLPVSKSAGVSALLDFFAMEFAGISWVSGGLSRRAIGVRYKCDRPLTPNRSIAKCVNTSAGLGELYSEAESNL
jgi:hypothetical protein